MDALEWTVAFGAGKGVFYYFFDPPLLSERRFGGQQPQPQPLADMDPKMGTVLFQSNSSNPIEAVNVCWASGLGQRPEVRSKWPGGDAVPIDLPVERPCSPPPHSNQTLK